MHLIAMMSSDVSFSCSCACSSGQRYIGHCQACGVWFLVQQGCCELSNGWCYNDTTGRHTLMVNIRKLQGSSGPPTRHSAVITTAD